MIRRETRQRKAIEHILRNMDMHPTADRIYEQIRKTIPNISKGTVYRNLKILRDEGRIAEINLSGNVSRYEGRQDNHYHFRCEKCGKIFDLDEPVNHELDLKITDKTGFKVLYHQLEFRGICRDCQK